MIKFDTTRTEAKQISRIVGRAMVMAKESGINYEIMDCDMDLTACHCNGNPLDLDMLECYQDFDFAHDVFGIRKHIDREIGKLKDCFVPRCSSTHRFALKVATVS